MSVAVLGLKRGVVRIVSPDSVTAGTGFVVAGDGLIVTCAHVVRLAYAGAACGLGSLVSFHLHPFEEALRLGEAGSDIQAGAAVRVACVIAWSPPEERDIAVLRPEVSDSVLPSERVSALPLVSTYGIEGADLETYGFPTAKPVEGLPGTCRVLGRTTEGATPVLAVRSEEVSRGFSGAPAWDPKRAAVAGMVVSIVGMTTGPGGMPVPVDPYGKQVETAFLIPAETIWFVCPELQPSAACPYRAFHRFEEEQAGDYFGRENATRELMGLMAVRDFVAVVGVSGSGKSSLLRAGLARGLREATPPPGLRERRRCLFLPGVLPLVALIEQWMQLPGESAITLASRLGLSPSFLDNERERTAAATALKRRPAQVVAEAIAGAAETQPHVLLIGDQFERVYVECPEDDMVAHFIDTLVGLARGAVKVLIALRVDFYGYAMRNVRLAEQIKRGQLTLLSMNEDELRSAIVAPAEQHRVRLEPGLVARLVADVAGRAGDLPLLEFSLTRLWETDSAHGLLTEATYRALGFRDPKTGREVAGVQGIVVAHAEEVWNRLNEEDRRTAEHLFLALYTVGPASVASASGAAPLASRRARLDEFDTPTQDVGRKLADSFLLTLGEDVQGNDFESRRVPTIEVAHEAILWNWPKLRAVVEEYGPFVDWRNKEFAPFLKIWLDRGQEDSAGGGELLPRSELDRARYWLERYPDALAGPPTDFIRASIEAHRREDAIRRRTARQRRYLKAGAVGLSVIALIITIALRQRQSLIAARERYEQAQVFLSDRDYLLAERAAADSLLHEDRPETRALLLEARARGARFSGRDALLGAVRCISRDARLVAYIGVSDEHDPMGNEAAKRLYVWDRKTGRRDALPPSTSVVHRAAFDPDGHILWYGTDTGVLKAWDRTRRREASISVPTPLSSGVSIDSLACQPADKEVAFGTSAVRKGVD